MEGGGATTDRKRKAEEGVLKPAAEDDDGVQQIDVVEGSKHSDGSIYRADAHPLHELFHLADTRETRLKPMRLTNPTPSCYPCWTACRQHLRHAVEGTVDLRRSLLRHAVEGTVEVRITRLAGGPPPRTRAVELEITGRIAGELVEEEIKLFRGVVRQPCALERFVVAARSDSYLFLHFKDAGAAGGVRLVCVQSHVAWMCQ